jgi:SulP family sulfate permease
MGLVTAIFGGRPGWYPVEQGNSDCLIALMKSNGLEYVFAVFALAGG